MRTLALLCLTLGSFFFVSVAPVYAVTVTATNIIPAQVIDTLDNTITVTVDVSSTTSAYLRGVFYKPGTSSYFGCTKAAGTDYYCGADPTQFPQLNGSGSLTLQIKADTSSSNFKGSGTYAFKVMRCTSGGCSGGASPEQTVDITQTVASTPSPQGTTAVPKNISLSEIYACPPSGQNEWVELYNGNNTDVQLTNWEIHDATETNKQKFSLSLPAYGYVAVDFSANMLNNTGDTVKLVDPNNLPVQAFEYKTCDAGHSWSHSSSDLWYMTTVTKNAANQFPSPSPTPVVTPPLLPSLAATTAPTVPATAIAAASAPATQAGEVLGMVSGVEIMATPSGTPAASPLASPRTAQAACGALIVGGAACIGFALALRREWYNHKT